MELGATVGSFVLKNNNRVSCDEVSLIIRYQMYLKLWIQLYEHNWDLVLNPFISPYNVWPTNKRGGDERMHEYTWVYIGKFNRCRFSFNNPLEIPIQ